MVKQSPSSKAIVPLSKGSLQAAEPDQERKAVIAEYLYKFAAIAGRQMTPELLAIYAEALKDLSVSRLKVGMREWLENGDRFPWPSDIRNGAEI